MGGRHDIVTPTVLVKSTPFPSLRAISGWSQKRHEHGEIDGVPCRKRQQNNTKHIAKKMLVGGLEHVFPYIGNAHPNRLIFSEGLKPPKNGSVIR